jgi:hypothetical protein
MIGVEEGDRVVECVIRVEEGGRIAERVVVCPRIADIEVTTEAMEVD